MKTSPPLHARSVKALASILSLSALSATASASMLFTFNTDPLDARPLGAKYISTPTGTSIQVIDTSSGVPFPSGNVRAIQLIDQSATGAPTISFQGAESYFSGLASFDFNFVRDTTFANTTFTVRLGNGGANGNISTADNIASQIVFFVKAAGGGNPASLGVRISDSGAGTLLDLDQTFDFNTAYRMEISFSGKGPDDSNTFSLTMVDTIGTRTELTRGSSSDFEYRAGSVSGVPVNTLWFQTGNSTNVSSSVYVDNVRMIPEPGTVSLVLGGMVALVGLKRWNKSRASSLAAK